MQPSHISYTSAWIQMIILVTLMSACRLYSQCEIDASAALLDEHIYRIKIPKDGVYRITYDWLTQIPNSGDLDLSIDNIQLLGIAGGALQEESFYAETERLFNIAFTPFAGENGVMDRQGEYLLFYATGSDAQIFDPERRSFHLEKNPYAEVNYVFLKIKEGSGGCLIHSQDAPIQSDDLADSYLYSAYISDDKVNLLDAFVSTQGSGQRWYGDVLTNDLGWSRDLTNLLPTSGLTDATIQASLAGRSLSGLTARLNVNDLTSSTSIRSVRTSDIEGLYAREDQLDLMISTLSPTDEINLEINSSDPNARLWIDQIAIEGTAVLKYEGTPLYYNNVSALQDGQSGLKIIGATEDLIIWDITHPLEPKSLTPSFDGQMSHQCDGVDLQRFVLFDPLDAVVPAPGETVTSADIIGKAPSQLIIITNEELSAPADRLRQHREDHSDLTATVVTIQSIYDLYSSGRQDPTAIRNYVRDLYHKYPEFAYLLLLGDASYDYRHINKTQAHHHIIPTYETRNSLDPLLAFPSDDYYALLDDGEGGRLVGDLDISVGRLTVVSIAEAEAVVDKIIGYDISSDIMDDWRTRTVYVADDEDNNLHINDADRIANLVGVKYPLFQQKKVYIDAYPQASTPGGNRYPDATTELNDIANKGALVFNYLGHGGPNGWAQERILKVNDLNQWTNADRLPLIITATCSFTGFDHPGIISAGEAALLNPVGGALALFTTVRSVYASKNFQLTRSTFEVLFEKEGGRYLPLGEIMRRAKNDNPTDNVNARKYFLIGDPTTVLAIPDQTIETISINGQDIKDGHTVKASALDRVSIHAHVLTPDGQHDTSFDGRVKVDIYDKPSSVQTLANDERSFVKSFESQQNILYSGAIDVKAGEIDISFVLPVDMDYREGQGKVNYFANGHQGQLAAGYSDALVIGGRSSAPLTDLSAPEIFVYAGDRNFVDGGTVAPNTEIIIDLYDDLGINLSNAAIGHEIMAILDGDRANPYLLNDQYQVSLDPNISGSVRLALSDLSPGEHQLTAIAYDVANNRVEKQISFWVDESLANEIEIHASPTPVTQGDPIQIEIKHHLKRGRYLVKSQVFTMSGALISSTESILSGEANSISTTILTDQLPYGQYILHFTINSRSKSDLEVTGAKKIMILK